MNQKKYETVQRAILGKVESGEWPPGEQILAERKLADLFGVSRITIQRAIEDLIEQKLLERVAGKKGTFVRADCASASKAIAHKESRLIGVAIDDISDMFGAHMLRGIEDCLWGKHYHTIICNADRNFLKVKDYFRSLLEQNLDGVIFSPVIEEEGYESKNRSIIEDLNSRSTPLVLIDRTVEGTHENFVSTDHRESSRRITRDFIAKGGHRRLILVSGLACSSILEREEGFYEAVRAAGLDPSEQRLVRLNDNLLRSESSADSSFVEELTRSFGAVGPETGLIALNGRLLHGASLALSRLGFSLGRFSRGEFHGEFAVPLNGSGRALVSMQPAYQVGYEAARLLLQEIETPGRAKIQVRLDAEVREVED